MTLGRMSFERADLFPGADIPQMHFIIIIATTYSCQRPTVRTKLTPLTQLSIAITALSVQDPTFHRRTSAPLLLASVLPSGLKLTSECP